MSEQEMEQILTNDEKWMQAYTELQEQYVALRSEYSIVVKTIIRALHELGMWPVTGNNMEVSKLTRKVPSLLMEAMMPGSALKDRFSFMKDIVSIAEKYKDIDINDL